MRQVSPVHHLDKMVAPALFSIGMKDLRVPPSQGLELFHLLRAKNINAKLKVYPEDTHAIDKPASEADNFVSIAAFLKEHLGL